MNRHLPVDTDGSLSESLIHLFNPRMSTYYVPGMFMHWSIYRGKNKILLYNGDNHSLVREMVKILEGIRRKSDGH